LDQDWIAGACRDIEAKRKPGGRVVFVSGNFNILHPGHLRLLNFAADCGDFLVVGVRSDDSAVTLLPGELRLESVRSIGLVGHAFLMTGPAEDFIAAAQPDIVVKGKEHEQSYNPEQEVVDGYGGRLLFCSGGMRFSSLDLLQQELHQVNLSTIVRPADYPQRHGFAMADLAQIVRSFAKLKVVVIGDLIVDEYISCDALGMSQEDPTLVVSPIHTDRFIGGAGIVAAHAKGLGADVTYIGVVGKDPTAGYAQATLKGYGVRAHLLEDESRPTTLKQRFRVGNKTMLRVSHLRAHDVSAELISRLYSKASKACDGADLVIFSDFNYGCLPQRLVDKLSAYCAARGIMMAADSQASSQVSDVSRFKGMKLLTPTEREARLAVRDTQAGLVVLAEHLREQASAESVVVTLGGEGLLIVSPQSNGKMFTDRLPAFNTAPKDVSGAGDSLLTSTSMALAAGYDIWQGTYLGAIAAALQVGRIGNSPLTADELMTELMS